MSLRRPLLGFYPAFDCRVCLRRIDAPRREEHLNRVCGPCHWRAMQIAHARHFVLSPAERARLLDYAASLSRSS